MGFDLWVSICDSAARLTPEACASSSSDNPRDFRRCRKLSATRRPSSAAPTSSPTAWTARVRALRFFLRGANSPSNILDIMVAMANTRFVLYGTVSRGQRVAPTNARFFPLTGLAGSEDCLSIIRDMRHEGWRPA